MLILLFLLLLTGCRNAPSTPEAQGRGLFLSLGCRACHRIGSQGGTSGPDLTTIGFRKSPAWLELFLKDPQAWQAGTLMPNPRLSDKAREALTAYLSTLKGQDFAADSAPWNTPELLSDPIRRGKMIFLRAGCMSCHGRGGAGGYPNTNVPGGKIPALNHASQSYTLKELKEKIRRGSTPAKADPGGPEPLISMPEWAKLLKDEEIDAVADYLFTLTPASGRNQEW